MADDNRYDYPVFYKNQHDAHFGSPDSSPTPPTPRVQHRSSGTVVKGGGVIAVLGVFGLIIAAMSGRERASSSQPSPLLDYPDNSGSRYEQIRVVPTTQHRPVIPPAPTSSFGVNSQNTVNDPTYSGGVGNPFSQPLPVAPRPFSQPLQPVVVPQVPPSADAEVSPAVKAQALADPYNPVHSVPKPGTPKVAPKQSIYKEVAPLRADSPPERPRPYENYEQRNARDDREMMRGLLPRVRKEPTPGGVTDQFCKEFTASVINRMSDATVKQHLDFYYPGDYRIMAKAMYNDQIEAYLNRLDVYRESHPYLDGNRDFSDKYNNLRDELDGRMRPPVDEPATDIQEAQVAPPARNNSRYMY